MGEFVTFLFWVVALVIFFWCAARILNKAGYSGWWSLIMLIPIVNIVFLWIFAFSKWPKE